MQWHDSRPSCSIHAGWLGSTMTATVLSHGRLSSCALSRCSRRSLEHGVVCGWEVSRMHGPEK